MPKPFHIISRIIIPVVLFFTGQAKGQGAHVSASIDTNIIQIGEQVNINLQAAFQAQDTLRWPMFTDTITKKIEIIEQTAIDTSFDQQVITTKIMKQRLLVTSFDTGYLVIPPFAFVLNGLDTLKTDPILLQVETVPVDTSKAIFDIKGPISVPFSLTEWIQAHWPWIVGGLVLVGLIVFLIYWFRKPKEVEQRIERVTPTKPPYLLALERLDALSDKKKWQQGDIKGYYVELSEILRAYLEGRFGFNALEQATEEIEVKLRFLAMDQKPQEILLEVLKLSDLVKFAKEKPIASESEHSLKLAYDFVKSTKPVEPETTESIESVE